MRVVRTGPVLDIVFDETHKTDPETGVTSGAPALCCCVHGRWWREGADWGDEDGTSCRPCSQEAFARPPHERRELTSLLSARPTTGLLSVVGDGARPLTRDDLERHRP